MNYLAIDVGGTFTDLVLTDLKSSRVLKEKVFTTKQFGFGNNERH